MSDAMAHGLVLQNDTLDPPALLGDWLDERGIQLVYLAWMDGHSSTNLRATARAMTK